MKTLIKLFIPLCLGIAITACSSMEQPNSESELNSSIENKNKYDELTTIIFDGYLQDKVQFLQSNQYIIDWECGEYPINYVDGYDTQYFNIMIKS